MMQRYGLLGISIIFLAATWIFKPITQAQAGQPNATSECLTSFDIFAYYYTSQMNLSGEKILPGSPWQLEVEIPAQLSHDFSIFNQVLAVREIASNDEIWISGYSEDEHIFAIYTPNTQTWETIPNRVSGTQFIVGKVIVGNDGEVWGANDWNREEENVLGENFPVLSQFNEETRQFEIPEGVIEISIPPQPDDYYSQSVSPQPEIVLDSQGVFWIFVNHDGIYRYDPITGLAERRTDLANYPVGMAVLSPDDSIYFTKPIDQWNTTRELFTLSEGTLLQYNPVSNDILSVNIPDKDWPVTNSMLFTRAGRLWLGAVGYREIDGIWNLLHLNPEEYLRNAGQYQWGMPGLIMESSDGRLWYNRYADSNDDGTAWYDPQTGEGCLFTNYPAEVIEFNQQLWMVAGVNLYRQPLNL
jgi:hypothetical protein